ncbi:helix-turn-helix transcriptional regulator [Amycolatopsis minnesotensis]
MMEHVPTVRGRQLGEGLRAVIEEAGLTGKQLARELGWSQSEVSRMLTGNRRVKEIEVAKVLGRCRVTGADEERLLKLCEEANKPGWYVRHHSAPALTTFIDHEDKATALYDYQTMLLPGSIQTGDYARAVISQNADIPADVADSRVAMQLARSGIFTRPGAAEFHYFLHEFVLHLPVAAPQVMSDQLHHLLRLSVRSNISIRVLPIRAGLRAGVIGSFTLMEFDGIRPVAYKEADTAEIFLDEPKEIATYRKFIGSLVQTALSEAQSRDLIGSLAVELYQAREERDEDP